VTATLLDFRGTDTFMEVAVIALAVAGARALALKPTAPPPVDSPVARGSAAVLAPVIVVVAGYLLWTGTTKPGGAFQAGAVLAGGLVLLEATTATRPWWRQGMALRLATVAGTLAFLVAGFGTVAAGLAFLDYPGAAIAYPTILAIESVATVSIAVCLAALLAADPEGTA
jgi:multisubunit Na+/H+ antiporter MnhB subunit